MRSRPQSDSPRTAEAAGRFPSPRELEAVAALWKRTYRVFDARFEGTSMLPAIAPLQDVTVRCGIEPQIGDVVLAFASGIVIVHRVAWRSRDGDWVLTQGDARTVPDPPIASADVVGIVDAPPHVRRPSQRIAFAVVRAATIAGRAATHAVVRTLQLPGRVRDAARWRRIDASHV